MSHNGVTENARFIQIPVQKIALPWTGVLHFVELLSASNAIDLIDLTYISSPCAQLLEHCEPGIHMSTGNASWKETAMDADVVFTDSFGTGWSNSSKDVEFQVSLDTGILQRAEWVKFLSLFFNKEKEATDIFSHVQADYAALQAEASKLKAKNGGPKVVAWTSWSGCADVACDGVDAGQWVQKGDGNWCQCGSTYFFYNAHFRRDVTQHAGGRLLTMPQAAAEGCEFTTNTDGSQTYKCDASAIEHVHTLLSGADMIVDETSVPNHGPYTLDDFAMYFKVANASTTLRAMTNEAVLRIDGSISDPREDGSVGSAWSEQMPVQPQQILSDMMTHMWGDAFNGRCDSKYLRHLHSGQTSTVNEHTDCPVYSSSEDVSCSAIHGHLHEVLTCAPASPSPSPTSVGEETSGGKDSSGGEKTSGGDSGNGSEGESSQASSGNSLIWPTMGFAVGLAALGM
jgi:hypothetical protein